MVLDSTVLSQYPLPHHWSIFSAEVFAVYLALQYVAEVNNTLAIICTDSLAAIRALTSPYSSKQYALVKAAHKYAD